MINHVSIGCNHWIFGFPVIPSLLMIILLMALILGAIVVWQYERNKTLEWQNSRLLRQENEDG